MSNNKDNSTNITLSVFLISLFIFVLTILPAVQATGSFLIGVAGQQPPENDHQPVQMSEFERWLSILSGVVAVISGIFGIQKQGQRLHY